MPANCLRQASQLRFLRQLLFVMPWSKNAINLSYMHYSVCLIAQLLKSCRQIFSEFCKEIYSSSRYKYSVPLLIDFTDWLQADCPCIRTPGSHPPISLINSTCQSSTSAISLIVVTNCVSVGDDTIRYSRLTCAQKLIRWPALSSARPRNEK